MSKPQPIIIIEGELRADLEQAAHESGHPVAEVLARAIALQRLAYNLRDSHGRIELRGRHGDLSLEP
jgi:hypothetical protein